MNCMIQHTPDVLVRNGRIETGFFQTPFRRVNLLESNCCGGPAAMPLRWLRLKEWVGFGLCHPRLFGGILVQDAKLAASGTVYLFDRHRRRSYEWLVLGWPGRVQLPETLWEGQTRCSGYHGGIEMDHHLDQGRHDVRIRIAATRRMPALVVDLTLHQDLSEANPLVVSLPIPPDHHTYTHKSPLRLEGSIRIGGQDYAFRPDRDLGNLDEQKTFYPWRSHWHWGCFVAPSAKGNQIMVNFVDQMTPRDQPGEDALWVDGRLMLMPRPEIHPSETPGEVRIEDPQGRMRLRFRKHGAKVERRNFGLICMDYEQAFGPYSGEVQDDQGRTHRIVNAFGALERMVARF